MNLLEELARPSVYRQAAPPMSQETADSLLGTAGNTISYLAEALGKPQAALFGSLNWLAGGDAGGGLYNLIPFSDSWLGDYFPAIETDPRNRVHFRDLMTTAGVQENKPGFFNDPVDSALDIVGLTGDVVFDPLNLISGPLGTVTKAGAKGAKSASQAVSKAIEVAKAAPGLSGADDLLSAAKGLHSPIGNWGTGIQKLRTGERGLLGVRLPGMDHSIVSIGGGKDWIADAAQAAVYGKYSPVPMFRQLFGKQLKGLSGGGAQLQRDLAVAKAAQMAAQQAAIVPYALKKTDELSDKMTEIGAYLQLGNRGGSIKTAEELLRFAAETKASLVDGGRVTWEALSDMMQTRTAFIGQDKVEEVAKLATGLVDIVHKQKDDLANLYKSIGGNLTWLDDFWINHAFRRATGTTSKILSGMKVAEQKTTFGGQIHRSMPSVPGGTLRWNQWAKSDLLNVRGLDEATAAEKHAMVLDLLENAGVATDGLDEVAARRELIRLDLEDAFIRETGTVDPLRPRKVTDDELIDLFRRAKQGDVNAKLELEPLRFSKGFKKLVDPDTGEALVDNAAPLVNQIEEFFRHRGPQDMDRGLFHNGYIKDQYTYMNEITEAIANIEGGLGFLGSVSKKAGDVQHGDGFMPLRNAWAAMQRPSSNGKNYQLLTERGLDTFAERRLDEMLKANPQDATLLQRQAQLASADPDARRAALDAIIDDTWVPEQAPGVLSKYVSINKEPASNTLLKTFDKFSEIWGKSVTSYFPAFHMRNLVDGSVRWMMADEMDAGTFVGKYIPALKAAFHSVRTGDLSKLKYADEMDALGIIHNSNMMTTALDTPGLEETITGVKVNPLSWDVLRPSKWKESMQGRAGVGPFRFRTEADQLADPATRLGDKVYGNIEFMNRAPGYIALRELGYDPETARQIVNKVQFDYSKASPFERNVGRRVFPFYSFVSHNIPYQFGRLMARPGGKTAQGLKMLTTAGRDQSLPTWLQEGGAIRMSTDEETGDTNLLSQFGLSIEDLGDVMFESGKPDLQRSANRAMGRTNPIIKLAYTLATGREPYSGRPLSELKNIGDNAYLGAFAQAMPTSRFMGTGSMLLDERKPYWVRLLNLMSGLKISTYDLDKLKMLDLRARIREKHDENPEVRTYPVYYTPTGVEASDKTKAMLEAEQMLTSALKKLYAQRRSQGKE